MMDKPEVRSTSATISVESLIVRLEGEPFQDFEDRCFSIRSALLDVLADRGVDGYDAEYTLYPSKRYKPWLTSTRN